MDEDALEVLHLACVELLLHLHPLLFNLTSHFWTLIISRSVSGGTSGARRTTSATRRDGFSAILRSSVEMSGCPSDVFRSATVCHTGGTSGWWPCMTSSMVCVIASSRPCNSRMSCDNGGKIDAATCGSAIVSPFITRGEIRSTGISRADVGPCAFSDEMTQPLRQVRGVAWASGGFRLEARHH